VSERGRTKAYVLARKVAWSRVAVGVTMFALPKLVAKFQPADDAEPPSLEVMTRTVGVRDIALGLGAVLAARSSDDRDLRRWVLMGLTSDALDTVTGLLGFDLLGRSRATAAALIPGPFIVGNLRALSGLRSA
jgi:hypothetical protein